MKIGIFSDVHGHLDELTQTLALFEHHNVDEIVCLGDLVDKGDHSDAVIDLMRQRAITCVQGNHDAKALYAWLSFHEPLQDSSMDYLSRLPQSLSLEWAGVSAYLVHANPWFDTSIYVFPTRPLALHQEVAADVTEKLLIMGHTHHPMRVDVDGKILLNPGSIYGNRDRDERTCAILSVPEIQFTLYDIDTGEQLPLIAE